MKNNLFTVILFALLHISVNVQAQNSYANLEENAFSILNTDGFSLLNSSELKNNNDRPEMFCFSIGISIFVSITTEVCCWRHTVRSVKYKCDFASNLTETEGKLFTDGYIDVETLGNDILDKIDQEQLTELTISSSGSYSDGEYSYSIETGSYDILSDEDGRYLKVIVLATK